MGKTLGSYCPEIVREFYASYIESMDLITPVKGRAQDQPSLTHILVREVRVDLSEKKTIHIFLLVPEFMRSTTIVEFNYKL